MAPWTRFSKSKLSLPDDGMDGNQGRPGPSQPSPGGDDLLQALNSDLQQTNRVHKAKINDQEQTIGLLQQTIEEFREEKELLQSQVWNFSEQLTQSRSEVDKVRTNAETYFQASRVQIEVAEGKLHEQMQELKNRSSTIKTLSAHNQKLQNRVADLETFVQVASRDHGTDFQAFFTHYSEVKIAHDELASKLKSEEAMRLALNERLMETNTSKEEMRLDLEGRLSAMNTSKDEMRLNLEERLSELQSENDSLKTVINELQKDASELEVCQPQTLRALLTLRLVEQNWNPQPNDEAPEEPNQAQNWLPSGLSKSSFDEICSPAEIQSLAMNFPKGRSYNQFYQRLKLTVCTACSKAKFSFKIDTHPRFNSVKWLNEYIGKTRYFPCCYEDICKECFKNYLIATLESKWWYKLNTIQWFPCPRDGCENALGIRCEADLETCLEQICGTDAEEHIKTYTKAIAFREALGTLDPKPSDEGLKKAAELHQKLFAANQMYSLFDARFDPPLVDETGCIPEFKPGMMFSCVMDDEPSPVPLFLKFLRRRSRPKSCIVCSKNMFDIDYGDVGKWKTSCKGFEGSWMWNILVFPTSEIQQCDHDFEICKACIAEHLRGSLTSGGPSACENLPCPQCNRKFSYQEVHKLADTETVAKYEKFLLQTLLSNEPGFRWCLAPLCENGQLYQRDPVNPRISCEECNFEMCFTHEMPWHEGLTCDEYESQRDHGDPSFAETREWIRTNTKPCPGCQVGIQKGEACFHMTCSQCNHQFCWQCLANWENIRSQGQEGHAEGCYFRTNNVRPTGVRGENLEDALRGRNAA